MSLFVVRPHTDHFHNMAVFKNLIDETMLNVNAAGISSCQISPKFLESWWSLERVYFEDFEEFFCFRFQSSRNKLLGIPVSLFGVDERPFHQESSVEQCSTGVLRPRTIFSRIFGIESKYSVSSIARQSSIETRTPEFFFPTMWIGSWDFSDSARSFSGTFAFRASTVFIRTLSVELIPI